MRLFGFVQALSLLALGGAVSAQSLDATINGAPASPTVSNGVVTIDVGTINADTVVHVFDDGTNSTTGPTLPLTGIVLKGTAPTPPATARLKLIVGNQDTQTDFQANPLDPMDEGVTDFGTAQDRGSIVFQDSNGNPGNTALRDITEVAIAVLGDIYADIDVGRVYRIQASGLFQNDQYVSGGTIAGTIVAHADDDPTLVSPGGTVDLGDFAINVITATRAITIIDPEALPRERIHAVNGSIGRITLTGEGAAVEHFRHHVYAARDIGAIFTSGPIVPTSGASGGGGAVLTNSEIWAGRNIEQVRTVRANGELAQVDAQADVRTGVEPENGLSGVGFQPGGDEGGYSGVIGSDAALGLLQVGGDFTGAIRIENLAQVTGSAPPNVGILVNGVLFGSITIAHNIERSKIVVRRFLTGEIKVGLRMIGAIVEFEREREAFPSGNLVFLLIGREATAGIEPLPIPAVYQDFTSGMVGSDCPPVDMETEDWWFSNASCDGGTYDSVVRCHYIGKDLIIDRMTLARSPGDHAKYMPRVEVRSILTDLIVGSMEAGVVWSGDVYDTADLTGNGGPIFTAADEADRYMHVPTVVIGCISPVADAWITNANNFVITRDLLGEVHVPEVPNGRLIRIGERLGNYIDDRIVWNPDTQSNECNCGATSLFNTAVEPCAEQVEKDPSGGCYHPCPFDFVENSPRGFAGGQQPSKFGRVRVAEPGGLMGQIVVNAANVHEYPDCDPQNLNDAARFWTGEVLISPLSGTQQVELKPLPDPLAGCCLAVQPVHQRPLASYGGGDVGEVPFRIHYEASSPGYTRNCDGNIGTDAIAAQVFLLSAQTQVPPIVRVRYDGPLAVGGFISPVTVHAIDVSGEPLSDETDLFNVTIDPIDNRVLNVRPIDTDPLRYLDAAVGARRFRVTPVRSHDAFGQAVGLVCNDGALLDVALSNGSIHVSDESFEFVIFPDCNGNEIADPDELILGLIAGAIIDCDGNGQIDACEILANPMLDDDEDGYLDSCQGACGNIAGDFNCDESIDTTDLLEYIEVWFAERAMEVLPDPSLADVNNDQVVDVLDVIEFVYAWINQCPCI